MVYFHLAFRHSREGHLSVDCPLYSFKSLRLQKTEMKMAFQMSAIELTPEILVEIA